MFALIWNAKADSWMHIVKWTMHDIKLEQKIKVLTSQLFSVDFQTHNHNELNIAVYYINIGFTVFFAVESLTKMTIMAPKVSW